MPTNTIEIAFFIFLVRFPNSNPETIQALVAEFLDSNFTEFFGAYEVLTLHPES